MGYYSEISGGFTIPAKAFDALKALGFRDDDPNYGNCLIIVDDHGWSQETGFLVEKRKDGVAIVADNNACKAAEFTTLAVALHKLSQKEKLPKFDIQRTGEEPGDFEGYTHLGNGKWEKMHGRSSSWNGKA